VSNPTPTEFSSPSGSSSSSIFNVNIITPTSGGDILRQIVFLQCISHESNAWQKRCVFRPDLKTGKEQGARRWSGNVFQSVGAAALKAAAAEEEVVHTEVGEYGQLWWLSILTYFELALTILLSSNARLTLY